jgi:hypothetical protein
MQKIPLFEQMIEIIDKSKNELVELCLQWGNIPSPHGRERKLGEAVLAWLNACGIKGRASVYHCRHGPRRTGRPI